MKPSLLLLPLGMALLAAFASMLLTATMRRRATGRMIDVPNHRSSHSKPTPRGGGAAIVIVVLAGMFGIAFLTDGWRMIAPVGFGALLVAGISLADDYRGVPSGLRLLVQAAAAASALYGAGAWTAVGAESLGILQLGIGGVVITGIWIVGLINAYNFMDGIDGIAGTQAIIAAAGWLCIAILVDAPGVAAVAALLAGAAAGFLRFNWMPASIFMGDVGSAFLGYSFAVLPLVVSTTDPRMPIVSALMVGPFVLDAFVTFVRRASKGENVLEAHRTHHYQRLVQAGRSHAHVATLYGLLALLFAASAIAIHSAGTVPGSASVATALAAFAGLIVHVTRVERRALVTSGSGASWPRERGSAETRPNP